MGKYRETTRGSRPEPQDEYQTVTTISLRGEGSELPETEHESCVCMWGSALRGVVIFCGGAQTLFPLSNWLCVLPFGGTPLGFRGQGLPLGHKSGWKRVERQQHKRHLLFIFTSLVCNTCKGAWHKVTE